MKYGTCYRPWISIKRDCPEIQMLRILSFALAVVLSAPLQAKDIRFVTLDFAPFIYGENNQVAGPGRDVIAAACETAELDCSFDIFPWRRAQELMREGTADGMMVIGRNAEREAWLQFSSPLFRTEYGFFVSTGNVMTFADLSQIEGFRVGVFAPSNTAVQLEALRDRMTEAGLDPIKIDPRPDDVSGFRKLAAGRLDAVYSNRDRGRRILDLNDLTHNVRYAGADKAILYYAAIRQSFPDAVASGKFFAALRENFANGRAVEIIEDYGLEPAPQAP
ncbi:transporter substrate-binding domain-containing protein [Aliiroseovarius sp. KMU-50]|uniref:Transporter substrate-binding domain-containing protein n=1 Tax=Aliiroseovarius salicola TaxID=3009082 RepID=A0ABT4W5F8_9RHOB|nr:transporter substrate-binding domain-containing protein [Aliiroseovarius sp. KMU-50]MDA5095757.1 transporter substrate-binding domain-containing protein [Aliiroseovarius sp. KMU-50]